MPVRKKDEFEEQFMSAIVTIKSKNKDKSLLKKETKDQNFEQFEPKAGKIDAVAKLLEAKGFKVLAKGHFSISIAASISHFKKTLGAEFELRKQPAYGAFGTQLMGVVRPKSFYIAAKSPIDPKPLGKDILHISIGRPYPVFGLVSAVPPSPDYPHLKIPNDIRRLLGVEGVSYTGKGVHVVMIDTGFWQPRVDAICSKPFHEYYNANLSQTVQSQIRVEKVKWWYDDLLDLGGHGTAMASGLFAVAPGIQFTMVKAGGLEFDWPGMFIHGGIYLYEGFLKVRELEPDIIVLCTGAPEEWIINDPEQQALKEMIEAEIVRELNRGTVIVAATGNMDQTDANLPNHAPLSWPSSHPDVIAVGGAYPETPASPPWVASDVASSGNSGIHSGRTIPDVCGICGPTIIEDRGQQGRIRYPAPYITMPTQWAAIPADLHSALGQTAFDAWLIANGTSCAAPMVAGVVALMLEKVGDRSIFDPTRLSAKLKDLFRLPGSQSGWHSASVLRPRLIKKVLKQTAIDVGMGMSANNHQAIPNSHDLATGAGVVNATAALAAVNPNEVKTIIMRKGISMSDYAGQQFKPDSFFP